MAKHEHKHNHDECTTHEHNHIHSHRLNFERKTAIVVGIAAITMVVEISFGYITESMALLADGWHMGSHVLALGLTWVAYAMTRKLNKDKKYEHSSEKLLALAGYTSAIILFIIAFIMAVEAINRLLRPEDVHFLDALIVAVIGLIVNLASASVLHHDHQNHDHNIRSAYMHVLADAFTSVTAIIALAIGHFYQVMWLDAFSAAVSSLIIGKWSINLIMVSGREILDLNKKDLAL